MATTFAWHVVPPAAAPAAEEEVATKPPRIAGRAVIFGLGLIGSYLAPLLARLFAHLVLVDRGRVEAHNCHNQQYRPEDRGAFKAEALARRLARDFPHLTVQPLAVDLVEVPLDLLRADVHFGCLDSRLARQLAANDRAWSLGIPYLDGGVGEHGLGRVQTFLAEAGQACLECGMSAADYRALAQEYPCGTPQEFPTLASATTGALVAALLAAEAEALLAGQIATSREMAWDLQARRFLPSNLRRSPRCRFDHTVVTQSILVDLPFVEAKVADLCDVLTQAFPGRAVQVELRPSVADRAGLQGTFAPLAQLASLAAWRLPALGLSPRDRLRVRASGGASAWCTFNAGEAT